MMDKVSSTQVSQMMKMAATELRGLSEENKTLREKVAHFEKKDRAEKIAVMMEEKGLDPQNDLQEKVASLMQKDSLDVIEAAVGMSAPQTKTASVADDGRITVEGHTDGDAANTFAASLASLD